MGSHSLGDSEPNMKVMIFGATGMVGQGVLMECLAHPYVDSILALGRTSCGINDPRLREIIHQDFFDYAAIEDDLIGYDACFFCLGVSAAGMSEEKYSRLTHDLTLAAAEVLAKLNPQMTFCYVSAAGTDSTEKGRMMWARVRGATENHLLELPFHAAFMFRPGYIQPLRGTRSKTRLYRTAYSLLGSLYPVLKRLFPNQVTSTEKLGLAMILVARKGFPSPYVETRDINALAEAAEVQS